ncbi:ABC transporter substrate-binding protein [Bradyrhizobium sp. KB893862 SZCCT0404]|uniref:ABC transporter substrate-binding protein n=1 Tax=Bradyrhizobium sp. KB893862 SZCCT0404 TaxID=2807672 RepID=UPI0032DF097A
MERKKMKVGSRIGWAAVGVVVSTVVAIADPIKVGAVVSTTGAASFLGEPELKTFRMEVERLNAAGGLLGRQIELVAYDDGSEAGKANGFAKRLIEDDKVDVLIAGTTTGASMAIVPLAEKAQIPFISLAGGISIIEPVKKWVFKTPHTDKMAVAKVLDDMRKHNISKIALLSDTSGFGQSGRKESQALAPQVGIEIVMDETYGPKDTDVTAQLTKIRASNAQAVFVFGFGEGAAIATKNIAQLSMALPHYESHGIASKEYIEHSGRASEGVRLPAAALLVADRLPDSDPQRPVVLDYTTRYTVRYKEDVSTFGGHVYDALQIWAKAVQRAQSVDHDKVRDEIERTKGYVGTGGVVNMSARDHLGLDSTAFRMLTIRSGKWALAD